MDCGTANGLRRRMPLWPSPMAQTLLIVNFLKIAIYMSHDERRNAWIAAEPPQIERFYATPKNVQTLNELSSNILKFDPKHLLWSLPVNNWTAITIH